MPPVPLPDHPSACVTSISQTENVFQWGGGIGSFNVLAPPDCNWTASSDVPWLAISAGQSGVGNGTISYFAAKNMTNVLREGDISVDTLIHRVRQSRKAQLNCSLGFDPINPILPAIGGSGSINFTGSNECAWEAQTDSPWLALSGDIYGNGNGSVSFTFETNFGV